jgi:hypothetical protein
MVGDNMFTIIGSVIGVLLGLITVITNAVVLSALPQLNLLLVYMIIMFSFMSFGAFAGMVIDLIIEKIK